MALTDTIAEEEVDAMPLLNFWLYELVGCRKLVSCADRYKQHQK